jgi:predicted DNA-binding transcriptional regulator AlpA
MVRDPLVPLKRVLVICGISRATLWRAARAGIEGFPAATKKAGRLYWRESELADLKYAITEFDGRTAFDERRQAPKRQAEARHRELALLKVSRQRVRRVRKDAASSDGDDLFQD